ncbi:hypothetical protein [Campylobacter sp.]|uniref:hypothetical protein n=1 Tax=Campylobacter sp. TaxID=205 RepID=UPI002A747E58|nr:hypothetical protein [Campylobacter sp.]MDY3246868.1 hypothetical protein [Campylobacter sp.]
MSLFYINCDCGEKIPKNGDIGAPRRKKPKFWSFGLELPPYDRKALNVEQSIRNIGL